MKGLAIGAIFILVLMLIIFSSVLVYSSVSPTGEFSRYISPFFSSISEKIHSILEPRPFGGCPTDNTYINTDTVLSGEYCPVNDQLPLGVLIINSSDIVLDCNQTILEGNSLGTGINTIWGRSNNVTIKNCIVKNYETGISITSGPDIITNNEITSNSNYGINITGCDNLIINNTISLNGDDGIYMDGCENNIIANLIHSNGNRGIFTSRQGGHEIINNTIRNNSDGIKTKSFSTDISGNLLINNINNGLYIDDAVFGTVDNNLIAHNGLNGIFVYNNSEIFADVIIINNSICYNNRGIKFEWSTLNNSVLYNNFISNIESPQASDDASNIFDDGNLGNYWSDYSGIDGNGDGIGDTPYIIDNDSQDNHPLMDLNRDSLFSSYCEGPESFVEPPTNLYIETTGTDLTIPTGQVVKPDITLTWSPSISSDVIGYTICRSETPYDFNFEACQYSSTTTTWTDYGVNNPDDLNYNPEYYYIVRAFDSNNTSSITTNTVGKFTKEFKKGSAGFALPLEPFETHTLDWYCNDIPNTAGLSYFIKGVWKFHACEMPEGVYDTEVVFGEGYQISREDPTIYYTFTGLSAHSIKYRDPLSASSFVKSLTLEKVGNDLVLEWEDIWPEAINYSVYRSKTRDSLGEMAVWEIFIDTWTDVNANDPSDPNYNQEYYYTIVPVGGEVLTSSYSVGKWTKTFDIIEGSYNPRDTFSLPLRANETKFLSWYCSDIPNCRDIMYIDENGEWKSYKVEDHIADIGETYMLYSIKDFNYTFIGGISTLEGKSCKSIKQITTDPDSQKSADIYGDIIVWMDPRNGNKDIYMYNLSTNTETALVTNVANQSSPTIYKDIVVWTDNRSGNEDIYMYNFSSKTETQVTTSLYYDYEPHVYEDKIVFISFRGDIDIYMYDLSTNTETQVTADTVIQNNPRIYGNRIVWWDSKSGNWDIYMYDLSTGQENQITNDPSDQKEPDIFNKIIVWEDFRNGKGDIYMYNITSGIETQITTNPRSQLLPAVDENLIVWSSFGGAEPYAINLYDISSKIESKLAETTPMWSNDNSPEINNKRIVFAQEQSPLFSNNWDIYMCELA
jgi:beta propeller repeat protein/parallel beta-helix repeat protein